MTKTTKTQKKYEIVTVSDKRGSTDNAIGCPDGITARTTRRVLDPYLVETGISSPFQASHGLIAWKLGSHIPLQPIIDYLNENLNTARIMQVTPMFRFTELDAFGYPKPVYVLTGMMARYNDGLFLDFMRTKKARKLVRKNSILPVREYNFTLKTGKTLDDLYLVAWKHFCKP